MNPKKPDSKKTDDLLNELDSVKSLLGDAAEDQPPAQLDEHADLFSGLDNTPVENSDTSPAGFDPNQSVSAQVRKALSERKNPFLATTKQQAISSDSVNPENKTQPATLASKTKSLNASDIDKVIDELVAEQLPTLEAELKARLRKLLK